MKPTCKSRVVSSIRLCNDDLSQKSRCEAVLGRLFPDHPIINLTQTLP
jgi:hypothetical protein